MVARMIVAKSQNLVKELQEKAKEIYAALFFFPAKRCTQEENVQDAPREIIHKA